MGFQRFSFLSLFSLFRSKKWTDAGAMAKKMNLGGNMTKGDGFQLGGAIVVDVGGKTLYLRSGRCRRSRGERKGPSGPGN